MASKPQRIKPPTTRQQRNTGHRTAWELRRLTRTECFPEEIEQRLALTVSTIRSIVPDNADLSEFLDGEPTKFMNDVFSSRAIDSD